MDRLCRACFDGTYPIELPEPELLGKYFLEGIESRVAGGEPTIALDVQGVPTLLGGGGAADALSRP